MLHSMIDVTCDACEPGTVQQRLASEKIKEVIDTRADRKTVLNQLKRKYGLRDADYKPVKFARKYNDRAAARRREKGVDVPNAKTEASSTSVPISKKNKGFKMLEKLGWSQGQGIGKDASGMSEPIDVEMRAERAGLGSTQPVIVQPPPQSRLEHLQKTRDRYNRINEQNS